MELRKKIVEKSTEEPKKWSLGKKSPKKAWKIKKKQRFPIWGSPVKQVLIIYLKKTVSLISLKKVELTEDNLATIFCLIRKALIEKGEVRMNAWEDYDIDLFTSEELLDLDRIFGVGGELT